MKRFLVLFLILAATVSFVPASVFAEHGEYGSKQCAMKGGDCDREDCGDCAGQCPITKKILKKAGFFLKNQAAIGLSDEQAAQITAIKLETKKAAVRAEAEMKVFELDMNEKLSAPKVDVDGLNAMIDQASAGWGSGAKTSIANYAKLKAVLNDAQMAKAKEIWTKDDKK